MTIVHAIGGGRTDPRIEAIVRDAELVSAILRRLRLPVPGPANANADTGRLARLLYRERECRTHMFEEDLFGEPAWDMLLDLYACSAEGRRVCVSSACVAANVPATTALRHLGKLEQGGLVRRVPASADRRSHNLELTPDCHARMEDALERIATFRKIMLDRNRS